MLSVEIKDYLQPDGLVSPSRYPGKDSTGNGLLYLSLYQVLRYRKLEMIMGDVDYSAFNAIAACQIEPGLFKRSPTKADQEGVDDYIGIAAYSRYARGPFARNILNYGQSHAWIFNNEVPGKFSWSSWFGRMPQVIAHFYYCAGLDPGFFRSLYWKVAMATGRGVILNFLMLDANGKDTSHLPMKESLAAELGEYHPITRYWI